MQSFREARNGVSLARFWQVCAQSVSEGVLKGGAGGSMSVKGERAPWGVEGAPWDTLLCPRLPSRPKTEQT